LPALIYYSSKKSRQMHEMERKYLKDLSDYEIRNFEELHQQLEA